MSVKRYDIEPMDEKPDGDYVKYEDYARVEAELVELRELRNEALRNEVITLLEDAQEYKHLADLRDYVLKELERLEPLYPRHPRPKYPGKGWSPFDDLINRLRASKEGKE